jgi:hypothetical protein
MKGACMRWMMHSCTTNPTPESKEFHPHRLVAGSDGLIDIMCNVLQFLWNFMNACM